MSQIAQALAKAKERTGQTTAPFVTAGGSLPPFQHARAADTAKAIRRAKSSQRLWLTVGLVALPLIGFVIWFQVRSVVGADTALPVAAAVGGVSAAPSDSVSKTSGAVAVAPAPVSIPASTIATPRPELQQMVNSLAISAVMPGEPPRIMLAGRVVRAGEVIEGGLVFSGVASGELRFNDARGATYMRRY